MSNNPFRNEVSPPVAFAYRNKQSSRGYSIVCEHCFDRVRDLTGIDYKYIDLSTPIKGIANLGT